MVVAKVFSGAPIGFDGRLVEVESDSTRGLPSIQIVGMAAKSVDEAKDRIKSAITNSLLEYPARKITINLAPAELSKDGTHYDLPVAIAVLVSSGQLRQTEVAGSLFVGELALDGAIRPISGIITFAEIARGAELDTLYVPKANIEQARLVGVPHVIGVSSLSELFLHLKGEKRLSPSLPPVTANIISPEPSVTLDDIRGQEQLKRALIIAATGRHNILLKGPPGSGKTMTARALAGLLPPLTDSEKVAVTKLHSLAGHSLESIVQSRPFRAPHHTASRTAIIGGGPLAQPGEISLAHLGVLFLDEIPEFPRSILETLRQPLEDKHVAISRAKVRAEYPADFMLVATMNPCPCGYYGDTAKECSCTTTQILAYQKRLSGPLLDRIDLVVTATRTPNDVLATQTTKTKEQHIAATKSIHTATLRQHNRYSSSDKYNNNLTSHDIPTHVSLDAKAQELLTTAADRLHLSARAYFKVLRVARTIADLDDSDTVTTAHISEALQYRGENS